MVLQESQREYLSIAQAGEAFRSRTLSPVELTQHLIARAEQLENQLHAFVTLTPEVALRQATAAEAAFVRGDDPSPLLGIPVGYKDIYCTTGVLTTAGSQLREGYVPDFDATAVKRLKDHGTVMMGKLTTWEFASGGADLLASYFPSSRNPWDPSRTPGGSSSGSGTALAAGLVLGALGTDTGGSIRMPAALCGIVGLKPTYGRVSRYGVFPLSWSLDHTGPMARTVEDVALLLNALAGYDPRDPASARVPSQDFTLTLAHSIKGVRVGVPANDYLDGCDTDVVAAFRDAVSILAGLGAIPVQVELPAHELLRIAMMLSMADSHSYHRNDLIDTPENFGPFLAQRMLAGGMYFASEYVQAQRVRAIIKEQLRQILLDVDVILTPSTPKSAQTVEDAVGDMARSSPISFTSLFNQSGLPSLSVPDGFSNLGLPIGLMISGRPFDEATVLRVGYSYQLATNWHCVHPTL